MSANGQEVVKVNGEAKPAPVPAGLAANYAGDRLSNVQRLGNILAASGYFADVKDMAQAAVKVMAGEELGIAPVAAVMGIHIIKGKVTLSANLIAAQVRRHGYDYRHVQFDSQGCTLHFFARNGDLLGESSFNEADAKTAGVYGDMYKKFPRNMYFSRAMSNGAKWYCPEVMSGLPVYTPEELGAKVDGDGDIVIEAAHETIDAKPIDTGGHPVGTQAAADYVAQRKITEMKRAAVPEAVKRAIAEPTKQEPPKHEPQPVVAVFADAGAQKMFAQMTDIKSTLKVFANLKKNLMSLFGDESGARCYYSALGRQGVEHANEFKSTKPARMAALEMLEAVRAGEQPAIATDADLPDFGEAI